MRILVGILSFLCSVSALLTSAKMTKAAGGKLQRTRHQFKMVPTPPSVSSGPFSCKEADAVNANMATVLNRIPPHTGMRERLASGDVLPLHPECMHLNAGWWKYELCWDKWVRQIHEENGVIHAEYFLGLGKNAKNKDSVTTRPLQYSDGEYSVHKKIVRADPQLLPAELAKFSCEAELTEGVKWKFKETKKKHMKSGLWDTAIPDQQQFPLLVKSEMTEGTLCDLTGQPRQTELIAVCDRSGILGGAPYHQPQSPIFFNVTEIEPCRYQVVVGGPVVCDAMMIEDGSSSTSLHTPSETSQDIGSPKAPIQQIMKDSTAEDMHRSVPDQSRQEDPVDTERIRPGEGNQQRRLQRKQMLQKAKEEAKAVQDRIQQRKEKAQAEIDKIRHQMEEVKKQEEQERRISEALQNENGGANTIDLTGLNVDINGIDDPEIQRQVAEALAKKVLEGHGIISGLGGQLSSTDSTDTTEDDPNSGAANDYGEEDVDTMIFSL